MLALMLKTQSYFDKLHLRTGYTYEGTFDACSAWGFCSWRFNRK